MTTGAEWIKVFTGPPTDAETVRGVLEGSGIAAVIERRGGGAYGLDPGPLGETTVSVQPDDVTAALDLLGEGSVPDEQATPFESEHVGFFAHPWVVWVGRAAVLAVIAALLFEATQ